MAGRNGSARLDFRSAKGGREGNGRGMLATIANGFQVLVILGVLAVLLAALHVQLQGSVRLAAQGAVLIAGFGVALCWHLGQGRLAFGLLALMLAVGAVWWLTIRPSNDRDWADEVAHGVTGAEADGWVQLSNVRNFRWNSREDYVPAWETRRYNLATLNRLDIFTSAWGNPGIAHLMVSFGFEDGQHVVFSTEIRRERTEKFSILGGFFKQFEVVLVAAEETDIIRLRTDIRGEQVSMFQLDVPPAVMADAFRNFLALGNDLAERPRFYNTLTNNCTTIPWRLARQIAPGNVPLDWRVVLSGHFPAYMQDIGLTGQGQSRDDMLAWARLRGPGPDAGDALAYSASLRADRP
jgi:hypothetical protein